MTVPFIGEIRLFAGNFAPVGWAFCEGQLLPINQYDTLFVLIGTIYGGDGQTTFALPDLRGRVPLHYGSGTTIGEKFGLESVALTSAQMPGHSHTALAGTASQVSPGSAVFGQASDPLYAPAPPTVGMDPGALGIAGGSQPHENRQPYLALNFIIATEGIFPSQS